jgi:hypothetical protein
MALSLNAYRRYINLKSAEGVKLYTTATNGFESTLLEGAKINLVNQDFQKLSNQMNRLVEIFGFDHLFKHVPKTCPINPAMLAVAAVIGDPTAVPVC